AAYNVQTIQKNCIDYKQCFQLNSPRLRCLIVFFFNDTATTEIYTLSLHDALPIYCDDLPGDVARVVGQQEDHRLRDLVRGALARSEEHTSELQSRGHLVCRLLLEKKKNY